MNERVSLMDSRFQMDPIIDGHEEEKNIFDQEEGKSDSVNDENKYSSKKSP